MASLQAALRQAGVTSATPVSETQPDLTRFEHKPLEVLEREPLWKGGIVQVKVPADARLMTAKTKEGPITYLQFGKMVKGGFVNFHVRGDDPKQFAGKNLVARAEVCRKNCENNRSFLYVDLFPAIGAEPTHRLSVMNIMAGDIWPKHVTAFETPAPLKGFVVVTDHDKNFS